MSLLESYPCSNISAPTSLSITSATFCSVLSVVAVVGNILVFLAVIIDPNRNLRSPFNLLVANLATADLIVGCFALPMSVEFYIREASTKQLTLLPRDDARRVGSFISCTASLFSLAAMSLDRFFAITNPMEYRVYRAKLNSRRATVISTVILLSIWIISIGLPFLYFSVGYLKYQFFFAITAVVSTFVVLCLTYVKVFKSLRNQVRTWDSLHQGPASYNHIKKRKIKWEKKVTKTFLIMLTLFISCFLPSLILILIISFCASCNCDFIHWARDLNYILIMANSSMNPFVFAWRLQPYRDAFIKILTCGVIARRLRSVSEQINISTNSSNPSSWISSSIQNKKCFSDILTVSFLGTRLWNAKLWLLIFKLSLQFWTWRCGKSFCEITTKRNVIWYVWLKPKLRPLTSRQKKIFLVKLWCDVSKTLLTSSFRNFSKKDLNKTAFRIANFAKIEKVTRIFLAISIIGPVLEILFNKVFNSGIFPQLWSVGYISTVFKASDIGDPNNYRGITVCSCFGKFFTLIINDRLTKYLNEHNIINTQQPNWLPKRL